MARKDGCGEKGGLSRGMKVMAKDDGGEGDG